MSHEDLWTAFETFYAAFPRHEAKQDAKKAWTQAKLTTADIQAIHEALAWQIPANEWKVRPTYCPLPATYLRGRRWTDERRTLPRSEHWSQSCCHDPKCERLEWHKLKLEKERQI